MDWLEELKLWLHFQTMAIDNKQNKVLILIKEGENMVWKDAFEEYKKVQQSEDYQNGWKDALESVGHEALKQYGKGDKKALEIFQLLAKIER